MSRGTRLALFDRHSNWNWRKRWDSNPRYGFPHAGFQDRFLKPLGHSSVPRLMTQRRASMQGLAPKNSAAGSPVTEKWEHRTPQVVGSSSTLMKEEIMLVKIAAVSLLSLGLATSALAQSSSGGSSGGSATGSGSGTGTMSGSGSMSGNGSGGTNGTTNSNPGIVDPNTTNSTINSGNSGSNGDSNDCRREPPANASGNTGPSGNVVSPDNSAACAQ